MMATLTPAHLRQHARRQALVVDSLFCLFNYPGLSFDIEFDEPTWLHVFLGVVSVRRLDFVGDTAGRVPTIPQTWRAYFVRRHGICVVGPAQTFIGNQLCR